MHFGGGDAMGMWVGTYDGDDVSMFILAGVSLLFPLHDYGSEMIIWQGRGSARM